MDLDDLVFLDATAMADLVRRREVRPIELVDACIQRIERLNPVLNAVVATCFDDARARAAEPLDEGPFAGVPFLLKDLFIEAAGLPATSGSAYRRGIAPDRDDSRVERFKGSGLIVLGTTNTPEFGLRPTTEARLFGPCRNPWDLRRTPGGSSGGSAAAVAGGLVPIAHASDGGGSIRIPASCCGLFGFKPSRSRSDPGRGSSWAVSHVVTRSVRDSAAFLDAVSPRSSHARSVRGEATAAGRDRLCIAFSTVAPTGVPLHEACIGAVHDAAGLCQELGHSVDEASPAIDGERMVHAMDTRVWYGLARRLEKLEEVIGRRPETDELEPLTWALVEIGRAITPDEERRATEDLASLASDLDRFFGNYDIWLHPTLSEPPPLLGSLDGAPGRLLDGWDRGWKLNPYLGICNHTGRPGMSAPLNWTAEGLPIGVHFAGIEGRDETLFQLATDLEMARPWAARRPVVGRV